MDERIGTQGQRPKRDVFGNRYTQAVSFRHIGDGMHVAVPAFAARPRVEQAITEIHEWLVDNQEGESDEQSTESDSDETLGA